MDTPSGGAWRRLVPGARVEDATPAPEAVSAAREPDLLIIGPEMEMAGRLVCAKSIRIDGEFGGELQSAQTVWISENGAVTAPIRARSVEIRGAVMGNVIASREVVIHSTGRLHGDVETPSFVITRGATFNGRTRMYRPEHNVAQAPHSTAIAPSTPGSGSDVASVSTA